jgi:hypothetical protein
MTKKIIIVLIALILIILGAGLFFLSSVNSTEIEKVTTDFFKTGDERRGGLVIQNSMKNGNKNQYVLTKWDLQRPVTSYILYVSDLPNNQQDIQFETFYLERTGLNAFKVKESQISRSAKYTFKEAVEIAKNYDIYTNNPDPKNIRNVPLLTQEQIESNMKLREETISLEKQWGFLQKIYNGIESQYPAPLDNEKKLQKRTELLPFLALSKEIQTTLNENKIYTATDGTIVQPTQANKNIIAENTQLAEWLLKQTE